MGALRRRRVLRPKQVSESAEAKLLAAQAKQVRARDANLVYVELVK